MINKMINKIFEKIMFIHVSKKAWFIRQNSKNKHNINLFKKFDRILCHYYHKQVDQ